MNFLSMDYFVMVAKERSFTKAAERLHITQQTLSAHIAGLEQELGNQLLIRHVPLELTYAGQIFLQYATDFQRRRNDMNQELGDIADNQKGLLRIGIANTRGRTIMPALIDGFQREYPYVDIRLMEATNDTLRQSLLDREIDLAIANFPKVVPGVDLIDFYQEEIVLLAANHLLDSLYGSTYRSVVAQANRGNLSPFQACPFLMNGPQDIAGRLGRELLDRSGVTPRITVESSNMETLLDLCVRGAGACFCPLNLLDTALQSEQIAKLNILRFGSDMRYMIRFGYRKQTYQWSILSNFITFSKRLIY